MYVRMYVCTYATNPSYWTYLHQLISNRSPTLNKINIGIIPLTNLQSDDVAVRSL